MTKILLEAGADPYAELEGKTALDMAREQASGESEFEVIAALEREARAVAAELEAWMAAHPRSE